MNLKKAAALAASVAALGAVPAASADAAVLQCGDVITQDTRLDSDVGPCGGVAPALRITAKNVTLDLHGHRVFGDGTGFGIISEGGIAGDSTITNGRVDNFSLGGERGGGDPVSRRVVTRTGTGILALGTTGVTITRNRMSDVGFGIESDFAADSAITRNRIRDCRTGIGSMQSAGGTSYSRNLVTDCTNRGYDIIDTLAADELVDNRGLRNGTGFFVRGFFGGATLTKNRAENNTNDGIDA